MKIVIVIDFIKTHSFGRHIFICPNRFSKTYLVPKTHSESLHLNLNEVAYNVVHVINAERCIIFSLYHRSDIMSGKHDFNACEVLHLIYKCQNLTGVKKITCKYESIKDNLHQVMTCSNLKIS